ncbi:hypothetical protein [Aurantiacibacter gilvus]|uniref:Uncharacterized protein n=1 Tax=Aurantiacibacter gilvus TaxID=3139141 RepID=A0ABU9IE13_9SPHN
MTSISTLSPLQAAQLDPGDFPDPDDPGTYRSAARRQVALTPARMADFLESLQVLGNVSIACRRAGVARQTAYRARRRSAGFARAWDAALVAARTVAEAELAERALNGVEEAVFYHGEEVARRRRYDSRLLLAHLARLDKAAERLDVAATLHMLDDQIDALRALGEAAGEGEDALPAKVDAPALRQAQDERDLVRDPAAFAERQAERAAPVPASAAPVVDNSPQDTVTPVTPCPANPCPDCDGFCLDAAADPAVALGEEDCMWLGNRLDRMDAARPPGAPEPHQLPGGDPDGALEMVQLRAFEDGIEHWWEVTLPHDAEEPAYARREDAARAATGGAASPAW